MWASDTVLARVHVPLCCDDLKDCTESSKSVLSGKLSVLEILLKARSSVRFLIIILWVRSKDNALNSVKYFNFMIRDIYSLSYYSIKSYITSTKNNWYCTWLLETVDIILLHQED